MERWISFRATPKANPLAVVRLGCGEIRSDWKINFQTASDQLIDSSRRALDQVVALLRSTPDITKMQVEGHTDNVGDPAQNRDLSTRRAAAVRERFADMNASEALVDTTRHPAMHKTRTVDYIILLSGRVTLLLDDDEVELEPFDVVVQRGTNHAWVNHGEETALLIAVLIDAEALP